MLVVLPVLGSGLGFQGFVHLSPGSWAEGFGTTAIRKHAHRETLLEVGLGFAFGFVDLRA